jgi:hypothetical protein
MQGGRGSGKHLETHWPGCEMGLPEWFSREDPLGTGRNMVHHWRCSPQELRLRAGMEVAWRRTWDRKGHRQKPSQEGYPFEQRR